MTHSSKVTKSTSVKMHCELMERALHQRSSIAPAHRSERKRDFDWPSDCRFCHAPILTSENVNRWTGWSVPA